VKELEARHRSMMRTLISGKSVEYTAELFDITPNQMQEIVDSPMFKEEMQKMEKELTDKMIGDRAKELVKEEPDKILKEATELAATTLKSALSDPNVHGRVKAAVEILNRASEIKAADGETVEPTQGFKDMMNRAMKEIQQSGDKDGSERVLETKTT